MTDVITLGSEDEVEHLVPGTVPVLAYGRHHSL